MTLYKLVLKILSPLASELKGDTIWGHFVWGIAHHEGDEKVAQFLNECKTNEAPLICSSAFPHDTICKPIFSATEKTDEILSIEKYAEQKKIKKQKYISLSCLASNEQTTNDAIDNPFTESQSFHTSVNRFSETAQEGTLFSTIEWWTKRGALFDLYILSAFDEERINELASWAFETGFGADASIGKGEIEIFEEAQKVSIEKKSRYYCALAPFVLDENEREKIKNVYADIFVRHGKLGGDFSVNENPYKKTVALFNEGAVLESDEEFSFVGKILSNVHTNEKICQSACAPVIPIFF